jgi:hypothetical protein
MPATSSGFLLVFAVLLVLAPSAHAFGAGDIPDFAYLNGEIRPAGLYNKQVLSWLSRQSF